MIITDKFVLLAFPKTGSSFTTKILRTIHARRSLWGRIYPVKWQKRDFPRPGYAEHRIVVPPAPPLKKARMGRHGTFRDIPEQFRDRTIASVVRNPFDRYVSEYLFQTRSRKNLRPLADIEELQRLYPDYPDLSFEDYYDMQHRFKSSEQLFGIKSPIDLGAYTVEFIRFYFRDPEDVLRKIDREYIDSQRFRDDMADIRFMHQERLGEEFAAFLREMDYAEDEYNLATRHKRENVARRGKGEETAGQFYSETLRKLVLERDALIFAMFPEYLPSNEADNS